MTKESFWESAEEIRLIQKRRAIRQQLQSEFNRAYYNPYRLSQHIELMDPAVARFSAMRVSIYENWKPNWKSFWKYMVLTYIPITLMAIRMIYYKKEVDEACRTGEIPYEKRDFRRF